jgi:hypothetical protein
MSVLSKMRSFFRKLGFDKGDERSVLISAFALRAVGCYVALVLLGWSVYELARYGRVGMPAVLFLTSQVVFWLAYTLYQRKFGG